MQKPNTYVFKLHKLMLYNRDISYSGQDMLPGLPKEKTREKKYDYLSKSKKVERSLR